MGLTLCSGSRNISYKFECTSTSPPVPFSSSNISSPSHSSSTRHSLLYTYQKWQITTRPDFEGYKPTMHSRSAIHQQRPDYSRMRSSSSQTRTLLHGWNPETETEREPNAFEGPPLSDFTRGLPKRNRAPSGRRPSASKPTASKGDESGQRRPSLVEKLRAAASRRLSETASSAVNRQEPRKKGPSLEATTRRRISNA